ncbi:MAG: hypothetical protein AAGE88_18175 [Actinomycetota bacterium]
MAQPGLIRFTYSPKGYRDILRSEAVRRIVLAKAERVADAARPEVPGGWWIRADSYTGRNRAGATVMGVPMRLERKRRILGRAMDAAR